ncbi:MAG: HAD-IB family hydrolase [Deltaproteobacteria bacterium]|nr:HAD-IB family hydrolase [Myxococcales bacterium]RZV50866.1 MAG: HAD-IB family hydrolase [Deltaproteobacteria bacterium]
MTLHQQLTEEIRTGPSGPRIGAFFDLDQTLFAGFSATPFTRDQFATGRLTPRNLADSLRATLSFTMGRTGFSAFVTATSAVYRGMAESVLEEAGQRVFENSLVTEIYPESRALVRAHQSAGHTVAIITSATRYQAEPVARELGIDHLLYTRLGVEDGILNGKVVKPTCYGEGKAIAGRSLAAKYDLDLDETYFYSDSHEDLPLFDIVGRPRPLNPNRKLAQIAKERQWPVRRFTSRGRPTMGDIARTGLLYGSLAPSVGFGLAAGLLNRSKREAINVMGSVWGDLAASAAGIDLRVEGQEHLWSHRPAVFIFNHQSGLELVLLLKLLRRDFTGIAKQEIRHNPIFGPLFQAAGAVFIDRSDTAKAIEALGPAVEALRHGRSLIIAPEGTRSTTTAVGPFKKGAFHLAMDANVPVVPVVFRNVLDALPKGALVVRPAVVEAVVLPPVDTSHWTHDTLEDEISKVRDRYIAILEGSAKGT